MIYGVDVSYAQGDSIDWDAAKDSGQVGFVYSRVCYGSNSADDDGFVFQRNHDECKRLGIPFGAYIFYLFDEDPKAQAEHFLQQASGRYGQLNAVVDVEEESGALATAQEMIESLAAFNCVVEKALGSKVMIYTNQDTWDSNLGGTDAFSGHPLWVASYGVGPGKPAMPYGWKSWACHQYGSGGVIPGIAGFVDLDCAPSLEAFTR